MDNSILSNIDTLRRLFKDHQVEEAHIFGSAVSNNFNKNSDLDFLIRFKKGIPPLERSELWWDLHDRLREHFNREIDILTEESLKNPYFIEEVNKTKQLIYG